MDSVCTSISVHSLSQQSLQYSATQGEAPRKPMEHNCDETNAIMVCGHFVLRVGATLLACILTIAVQPRKASGESHQHTSYVRKNSIAVMSWSRAGVNRGLYGC